MVMTDPIADMLTRIRNAQMTRLLEVTVPYSAFKLGVLGVLREEGYISDINIVDIRPGIKDIVISLKYSVNGKPAISLIEKLSRPGRRYYTSPSDLREFCSGMGIHILSTSKGVISDREAHVHRVGGEVICRVF